MLKITIYLVAKKQAAATTINRDTIMRFSFHYFCLIIVIGGSFEFVRRVSSSSLDAEDNPCKGKPFSSVCKIMIDMKRDLDYSNEQTKERFGEIKQMFEGLNEQKEAKSLVEKEVEALSKIQASGIKMVTKEMEKRVETFSQMLKYKIQETKREMDLKTDTILRIANKDVVKLRDDVIAQFKANKAVYKNGVSHLEAISDENRNVTSYIMKVQKLTIENEFNSKLLTLKSECFNEIAAVEGQLKQQIQQNHLQVLDLKKKIEGVNNRKWPLGSYCILANGACPTGFKTISGQMRAISMYSANSTYMKEAVFGASKMTCHGLTCGKYGHWIGDLSITACCK